MSSQLKIRRVILFLVVGGFLLSACVSLPLDTPYKGYAGVVRPESELAMLRLGDAGWVLIDDERSPNQRIHREKYGQIKLLPGTHRIEWEVLFVSVGGDACAQRW